MVRVGRRKPRERHVCARRQPKEARRPDCRPLERQRYSRTSAPGAGARAERRDFRRCWEFDGSPSRTRTCDKAINSRLLYQLSYRGSRSCLYTGWPSCARAHWDDKCRRTGRGRLGTAKPSAGSANSEDKWEALRHATKRTVGPGDGACVTIRLSGKDGGLGGNRTPVQGFAVLCVTTPPRGHPVRGTGRAGPGGRPRRPRL